MGLIDDFASLSEGEKAALSSAYPENFLELSRVKDYWRRVNGKQVHVTGGERHSTKPMSIEDFLKERAAHPHDPVPHEITEKVNAEKEARQRTSDTHENRMQTQAQQAAKDVPQGHKDAAKAMSDVQLHQHVVEEPEEDSGDRGKAILAEYYRRNLHKRKGELRKKFHDNL